MTILPFLRKLGFFRGFTKASKMLRKSYQGYLAYAIKVRDGGSRLEDIPVVREFSDVFPDDLPSIPLD